MAPVRSAAFAAVIPGSAISISLLDSLPRNHSGTHLPNQALYIIIVFNTKVCTGSHESLLRKRQSRL